MTDERRECGDNGGRGIGAGHVCRCVLKPDHMVVIPQYGHGCYCGAIWGRVPAGVSVQETRPETEGQQ